MKVKADIQINGYEAVINRFYFGNAVALTRLINSGHCRNHIVIKEDG